jgi:hypothetical protein
MTLMYSIAGIHWYRNGASLSVDAAAIVIAGALVYSGGDWSRLNLAPYMPIG